MAKKKSHGIQPVGSGLKRAIGRGGRRAKSNINKIENKVIRGISKLNAPEVRAAGIVAGSALTRKQRIKNATPIDRKKLGQHPNAPKPKPAPRTARKTTRSAAGKRKPVYKVT